MRRVDAYIDPLRIFGKIQVRASIHTVKEILHKKRKATENISGSSSGKESRGRYTAMMQDHLFLILGILSDIGWRIHLTAKFLYWSAISDGALAAGLGCLFWKYLSFPGTCESRGNGC